MKLPTTKPSETIKWNLFQVLLIHLQKVKTTKCSKHNRIYVQKLKPKDYAINPTKQNKLFQNNVIFLSSPLQCNRKNIM